jgi:hypothetical protein
MKVHGSAFQAHKCLVSEGSRLPIPHNCPSFWAALIIKCWEHEPSERPTFDQILEILEEFPDRSFDSIASAHEYNSSHINSDGAVGDDVPSMGVKSANNSPFVLASQ